MRSILYVLPCFLYLLRFGVVTYSLEYEPKGIQLERRFRDGEVTHQFVEQSRIKAIVINEGFRCFEVSEIKANPVHGSTSIRLLSCCIFLSLLFLSVCFLSDGRSSSPLLILVTFAITSPIQTFFIGNFLSRFYDARKQSCSRRRKSRNDPSFPIPVPKIRIPEGGIQPHSDTCYICPYEYVLIM